MASVEDHLKAIREPGWEKARYKAQTLSINNRLKLLKYNQLMRMYETLKKVKLIQS